MNDNFKEDLEAKPTLSFPPPRPIAFKCQCGCGMHVSEGEACFKYKGIMFAMAECVAKHVGADVIFATESDSYFNIVLTICQTCREDITVKASYKERNNKFYCESCKQKEQGGIT